METLGQRKDLDLMPRLYRRLVREFVKVRRFLGRI
jgi:hypothetical protein